MARHGRSGLGRPLQVPRPAHFRSARGDHRRSTSIDRNRSSRLRAGELCSSRLLMRMQRSTLRSSQLKGKIMRTFTRVLLSRRARAILSGALVGSALFFPGLPASAQTGAASAAHTLACPDSRAVAANICRDEHYPSSKCKCGPHGEIRWAKCTISKDPSTGKVCRGPWCQSCYTVCKMSAKAYRLYRQRSQILDARRPRRPGEVGAPR